MRIIARGSATGRIALPPRRRRGVRTMSTHTFARLLVCPHDGTILTASWRNSRAGREVSYFCRRGRQAAARCGAHREVLVRRIDWRWDCPRGHVLDRWDVVGDHSRPWSVPEHVVLAWAKATAEVMGHGPQFGLDGIVRAADTDEATVTRLQEQRRRVVGAHIRLDIGDEERDTLIAGIDSELDLLQSARQATATWTLGLDWTQPSAAINARLREVLHSVVLGADMRPVAGVWTRQPHIDIQDSPDGLSEPDPAAKQVAGGWLIQFKTDDRRRYGRPARTSPADDAGVTKAAS